jgi:DNA-binding CsgD family transcriptional regulator
MRADRFSTEAYSGLVGDIYECALEPSRWNDTLTRFVSVFSPPDWDVAALMWEGMNTPGVRWVGTTGLVAHAIQAYESVFAGTNVWSARAVGLPLGQVFDTDELVTRAEFLKSDLYLQFFKTWGMELALFVLFERTDREQLALSMPGPDGRDLGGLKRGLRLVAPHIQRAMRISHGLAEARLRAAGAEAALDLGHVGVLALGADLTIVSQNAKAQLLAANGLFSTHERRVLFADADAQKRIAQLARHETPASEAFRIEDRNGASFAVLAMTIRPQREQVLGGWIEGARVLVSISTPHPAPLLDVDRLRAWFDLTPSEARLAAALAAGKSLAVYSEERGVSVEAARYLLKGAFRKTGAESQAQLVTLIGQVPRG